MKITKKIKESQQKFRFKQFTVEQSETAMKVGTDGVLLGAWTDFSAAEKILDIGTGTGLIALMAAQRCNAKILAIEIEENAARQALRNFENSPWKERLIVENLSFADFCKKNTEKFDVIVCNPPYFSNSLKNPDSSRTLARHDDSLSVAELLKYSSKILADKGKLSLILPSENENSLIENAEIYGLFVNKITEVKPNPKKEKFRILAEMSKQKNIFQRNSICVETEERHCYSTEYINLTKEFYLKM